MDLNKISLAMLIMWFLSAVCFFMAGALSENCMFSIIGYIQSAVGLFFVYSCIKQNKQCGSAR